MEASGKGSSLNEAVILMMGGLPRVRTSAGNPDEGSWVSSRLLEFLEAAPNAKTPVCYYESALYLTLQHRFAKAVRDLLRRQYQLEFENIPIDQPPNVALGEYAMPLAFELAKKLRKPPRKIAEEIVAALDSTKIPGFEKFE